MLLVLNDPSRPKEPIHPQPPPIPELSTPNESKPISKGPTFSKSRMVGIGLFFVVAMVWKGYGHKSGSPDLDETSAISNGQQAPTDLSNACASGDLRTVKAMARQYNVNVPGSDDLPLNSAAKWGSAEMVNFLISKGALLDKPNGWGRFPIHSAAEEGNLETLKALEAAGADIRQRSGQPYQDPYDKRSREFQPIHAAARRGKLSIVRYLVSRGADPSAKDARGETPYSYAWSEGRDSTDESGETTAAVMKYLKSISADCEPTPYRPSDNVFGK